ncbi:MAG: hypothetical protein KGL39_48260, partial [Patescibacteria group bacterium]|nr:hypothetical protein [Patescibacteria group bacterium]
VETLALREPGETVSLPIPEGYSDQRFADELLAGAYERCADRVWYVHPLQTRVVAAWLPIKEGWALGTQSKWEETLRRAEKLAIGEYCDIDPWPNTTMERFITLLRASLYQSPITKKWQFAVREISRENGSVVRVTKMEARSTATRKPPVFVKPSLAEDTSRVEPTDMTGIILQIEARILQMREEITKLEGVAETLRGLRIKL